MQNWRSSGTVSNCFVFSLVVPVFMSQLSWMWKNQSLIFHIISPNQCICLSNLSLNSLFNLPFLSKQKHIKRKTSQIFHERAFLSALHQWFAIARQQKKHPNQPSLQRFFLVHPLPISIQPHRLWRRVPSQHTWEKNIGVTYETSKQVGINKNPSKCRVCRKKSRKTSRYTVYSSSY